MSLFTSGYTSQTPEIHVLGNNNSRFLQLHQTTSLNYYCLLPNLRLQLSAVCFYLCCFSPEYSLNYSSVHFCLYITNLSNLWKRWQIYSTFLQSTHQTTTLKWWCSPNPRLQEIPTLVFYACCSSSPEYSLHQSVHLRSTTNLPSFLSWWLMGLLPQHNTIPFSTTPKLQLCPTNHLDSSPLLRKLGSSAIANLTSGTTPKPTCIDSNTNVPQSWNSGAASINSTHNQNRKNKCAPFCRPTNCRLVLCLTQVTPTTVNPTWAFALRSFPPNSHSVDAAMGCWHCWSSTPGPAQGSQQIRKETGGIEWGGWKEGFGFRSPKLPTFGHSQFHRPIYTNSAAGSDWE